MSLDSFSSNVFERIVVPVIFLLLLPISPIARSQEKADERVVGVLENWPPQYSINPETKKPTGFAIDIFENVAERVDIPFRYKVYKSWPELMQAFEEKEVSLIPNLGITSERHNLLENTIPYEAFHIRIFVRQSYSSVNTVDDLAAIPVGVVEYNKGLYLMKARQHPRIRVYDCLEKALLGLLAAEIDALVYPEPPLMTLIHASQLEDKIKTVGEPLLEVKRGIAIHQGETELLNRLNTALRDLIGSEEYKRIYLKWFGQPAPYWTAKRVVLYMVPFAILLILVFPIIYFRMFTQKNRQLQEQIEIRKKTEKALIHLNGELERKIEERTSKIAEALQAKERLFEKMQHSEQRYRSLIDQSLAGIGVSHEGRILFVNEALCDMFGIEDEEAFCSKSLLDYATPESRKKILERMERVKAGDIALFISTTKITC